MSISAGSYPTALPNTTSVVLPNVTTIPVGHGKETAATRKLLMHVYADLAGVREQWLQGQVTNEQYARYVNARAILTPTNKGAEQVNAKVNSICIANLGPITVLLSADAG
jgi:hypothetical protein